MMCIISFHFQQHPKYKLIVVANRDEFYRRPTKHVHFWEDKPNILAGRDLEANGSWMGITKEGRFAALTNYRDVKYFSSTGKRSRGEIVTNFLSGSMDAEYYLQQLHQHRDNYNGFNVIVGTADELYYYGNEQGKIVKIEPGTHSLSNELLNSPWPKVERAKSLLSSYVLNNDTIEAKELFSQLHDDTIAADDKLPNTGVGISLERQLSPIFIRTEDYGTRSSSVLLITHDNEVQFIERVFNDGQFKQEIAYDFTIKER